MTGRMLAAIESPHTDILGHCTGRLIAGRGRPQSSFDAEAVFSACARTGTAVEINSRPERQDPPEDLLRLAVESGVFVRHRHATRTRPASWNGSDAAAATRWPPKCRPNAIVNRLSADELVDWAATRRRRAEAA